MFHVFMYMYFIVFKTLLVDIQGSPEDKLLELGSGTAPLISFHPGLVSEEELARLGSAVVYGRS